VTELYPGQNYFLVRNENIRRAEEKFMHQEFEVHLLNDEGIAKAKRLAELFDNLLTEVETLCLVPGQGAGPNARQMAIVRTKLEEASFFSKKALAIIPENQK
jgi:hypothetical protein